MLLFFFFFSLYLSERIRLRPGHQHQWCFFTVRSCRGSRVMAALRSMRGFDQDETATQAFTRGKKFTQGTFDSACLLACWTPASSTVMSEGDANDVWMQKLKPIYLYVFIFLFCLCWVQQDHTPRSKFTLIQHCWYWYFKYCIYSCIFNTDVCIIHVLYIYVREVKWFVYSARLLLLGRSLLQLISKLSNKSEN